MLHQIGNQSRQPVVLTFRPAVFDRYVLAVDMSRLFETLHEGCHKWSIALTGCTI